MKIKDKKENLLESIQLVQITSPKTTLPILSNILIEAKEDKLTLISTDLELSIKVQSKIEVLEEGSVCLPLRKLVDIIRELEKDEDVVIEIGENNCAVISSKDSIFHLFGFPKEDFPIFPEYIEEKTFTIPSTLLKEAIRKVIFATAVDDIRYVLNGVFFVVSGNECKMVATDGHRLAFIKKILPGEVIERSEVIVPSKVLTELNKIIPENKNVNILLDKNKIIFKIDQLSPQISSFIMVSKLIEGKYPDYERVIPKEQDKILRINNQKLLSTCRRIALMTSEKTNALKFDISKNKLKLSSSTPNLGTAEEELEVDFQGNDIEISFNPKYIMDVLKNIEEEEVYILLKGSSNSILIKPVDRKEEEEYLCVVMPVRT